MNCINPDLVFTTETVEDFRTKRSPTLGFRCGRRKVASDTLFMKTNEVPNINNGTL